MPFACSHLVPGLGLGTLFPVALLFAVGALSRAYLQYPLGAKPSFPGALTLFIVLGPQEISTAASSWACCLISLVPVFRRPGLHY